MPRFVDFVAVEGPDRGMRYTVEEGSYRVLARAQDDSASTVQMTPEGDRLLDPQARSRAMVAPSDRGRGFASAAQTLS